MKQTTVPVAARIGPVARPIIANAAPAVGATYRRVGNAISWAPQWVEELRGGPRIRHRPPVSDGGARVVATSDEVTVDRRGPCQQDQRCAVSKNPDARSSRRRLLFHFVPLPKGIRIIPEISLGCSTSGSTRTAIR